MTGTIERTRFDSVVTSQDQLRAILGEPSETVKRKVLPALDEHSRNFIGHSPFALVSTANAAGQCDVSPRGDGAGFALVLDERTIAIPERPGNRRADTLGNLVDNPWIGLIFLIPGVEESLRVNGRAQVVQDETLLERLAAQGKVPKLAIVVTVEEAFFHCGKAIRRSRLWDAESRIERSQLPTFGRILMDQQGFTCTVEELDERIERGYRTTLY